MCKANRETRTPEFLASLIEIAVEELGVTGLDAEQRQQVAVNIASRVARDFGGEQVYVPKGTLNRWSKLWHEIADRNARIRERYNGRNGADLCASHSISRGHLFRIVSR
jgi:Mor family transcriptional regulator